MRMPPEIRYQIDRLGARTGVCLVKSRGVVVKVLMAKCACEDLAYLFRSIAEYDQIVWITNTEGEHMLHQLAQAQVVKYDLLPADVLRPRKYYTREHAAAKHYKKVAKRDQAYKDKHGLE